MKFKVGDVVNGNGHSRGKFEIIEQDSWRNESSSYIKVKCIQQDNPKYKYNCFYYFFETNLELEVAPEQRLFLKIKQLEERHKNFLKNKYKGKYKGWSSIT